MNLQSNFPKSNNTDYLQAPLPSLFKMTQVVLSLKTAEVVITCR